MEQYNLITKPIHLLIGYKTGNIIECSIDKNRIGIKKFELSHYNLMGAVQLITPNINKKSFYVVFYHLAQFDIHSRKCIKKIKEGRLRKLVLTYDGRYLITDHYESIQIRSARTYKLLFVLDLQDREGFRTRIRSLTCSYDSKYLFIGSNDERLKIFDLKNFCIIKNNLKDTIHSIVLFKDNQNAIVIDNNGNIKKLNWKVNAKIAGDFIYIKQYGELCNTNLLNLCLSDDQETLFIGSGQLVKVFNLQTCQEIKVFVLKNFIKGMELIDDEKKVVLIEQNGNLTIINSLLLEIIFKKQIDYFGKYVEVFKVIY